MLRSALLLLAAAAPFAATALPETGAAPRPTIGERLSSAARAFLDQLGDDARAKAALGFDDAERTNWQFVPGIYPGVPLADLDLDARRLAHRLLREALGTQGALKTLAIVHLEDVLRERAQRAGQPFEHRDPERYALAVFGEPSPGGPAWGFRFQGHHVSLNFTVIDGETVTATPRFFGANPHEMRDGTHAGERVLATEEDSGRRFVESLSADQRGKAILADAVPKDVLVGPGRVADILGEPKGIDWADLSEDQRLLLVEIVSAGARDLDPAIGRAELIRMRDAGYAGLHFAWIGSTERGEPHYYRLHGPSFVIEYDNIQDGANHSHTVWHDVRNGFGGDLLRAHYEAAHRKR